MSNSPIVSVVQGLIKGLRVRNYVGKEILAFHGVPYAKAPIGELRFKPPEAPESWAGIRDGTVEGPPAPSRHMFFNYLNGSEDNCLHLNIYTHEVRAIDGDRAEVPPPKPVMVFIHAGAFAYGSNTRDLYGPKALLMEDIVLVTMNYRLGVLGFLALEDNALGVPGNMGLKDMVAALKWIQTNIRSFNGNPENVTIFGESAGGAAVHYLLLSPLTKGLFHRAIMQSGCALNCWAQGHPNARPLAKQLNLENCGDDESKILQELRQIPVQKLIKAQFAMGNSFYANYQRAFAPVVENPSVEGAFLTEHPLELMRTGRYHKVPLIIGYNSHEGLLFGIVGKLHSAIPFSNYNFEREVPYELKLTKGSTESKQVAERIKKFYFKDTEPSRQNIEPLFLMKMDNFFSYDINRTVNHQKRNTDEPIFMYRFCAETCLNYMKQVATSRHIYLSIATKFLALKCGDGCLRNWLQKLDRNLLSRDEMPGVCHVDELGYLFNSFLTPSDLNAASKEFLIVRRLVRLWTNFAATGQPTPFANNNDDILPESFVWKPVDSEANHYLDFGTDDLVMRQNSNAERMRFWDDIYDEFSHS